MNPPSMDSHSPSVHEKKSRDKIVSEINKMADDMEKRFDYMSVDEHNRFLKEQEALLDALESGADPQGDERILKDFTELKERFDRHANKAEKDARELLI